MHSPSSTTCSRLVAASSRSPTSSTTTSQRGTCSARSTRGTGPMRVPSRRSCARPRWPPRTMPPAVSCHRAPGRSADVSETRAFERLLVTGGAGFIGSCYVRDALARRDGTRITVLDKLTYAGNEANLAPVRDDPEQVARFRFFRGDIADPAVVGPLVAEADAIVNFAAESHVD